MKKIVSLAIAFILTLSVSAQAIADSFDRSGRYPTDFRFFANEFGRVTEISDVDYAWATDDKGNQVMMVPLRFISESLHATVSWDSKIQTATVHSGRNKFYYQIGSRLITANWWRYADSGPLNGYTDSFMAPVAPYLNTYTDRMMVSFRYAAELLGYEVIYDGQAHKITFKRHDKGEGNGAAVPPSQLGSSMLTDYLSNLAYDKDQRKLFLPTTHVMASPSDFVYYQGLVNDLNRLITNNAVVPTGGVLTTRRTDDGFQLWLAKDVIFTFDEHGLSISLGDVSGGAFVDGLREIKKQTETQAGWIAALLSGLLTDTIVRKVPALKTLSEPAKVGLTMAIMTIAKSSGGLWNIDDYRITVVKVCKDYGRNKHIVNVDSTYGYLDNNVRQDMKLNGAYFTINSKGQCVDEALGWETPFIP